MVLCMVVAQWRCHERDENQNKNKKRNGRHNKAEEEEIGKLDEMK